MHVANLARWEWFKLRHRWMPWILLIILMLFFQIGVWGTFFAYQNLQNTGGQVLLPTEAGARPRTVGCNALLSGDMSGVPQDTSADIVTGLRGQCQQRATAQVAQLGALYEQFTLPGSITNSVNTIQIFGLMLLAILTASVVGVEYGLGTLRTALVRGTGRISYLAGKFIMLSIVAALALLIGAAFTALSSMAAMSMAGSPPTGAAATGSWGDAGMALFKVWSSVIPYLALTGFVTVLARSSSIGMAIGLAYLFAEQILVGLLSGLFTWFADVADYLPVKNILAWAGGSSFDPAAAGEPSQLQVFSVLVVYSVVLIGAAFWLMRKRDVAGASGG